jgi:Transposase IS116/IS110/IS902 family
MQHKEIARSVGVDDDVIGKLLTRATDFQDPRVAGLVAYVGAAVGNAVGPEIVEALAGDSDPDRLRSEAAFARLCGVAPIPASSGETNRHRLHHGGDRAANSALHIAEVVRLRCDPRLRRPAHQRGPVDA